MLCEHNVNRDYCRACKAVEQKAREDRLSRLSGESTGTEPTDEQIENLRSVFYTMFGPYALLMSREKVVALRDHYQRQIDMLGEQIYEEKTNG